MSSSTDITTEPSDTSSSVLKCGSCGYVFHAEERFFRCSSCHDDDSNLCQPCGLAELSSTGQHRPRPCFLDSRDARPTFLPAPSIADFRDHVAKAKVDESFRFPIGTKRYLSQSTIEGLSRVRLLAAGSYVQDDAADTPAITRSVTNDYSLYEALDRDKKDVRLILLLKGSLENPVGVLMARFSFPWKQVPYMALSYRWGELDETRSISVIHISNRLHDGGKPRYQQQEFAVTANLEMALRGIRREDSEVWLWVDAICINQGDCEERAYQVNIMAEIYSRASAVSIWLGLSFTEAVSVAYVRALTNVVKRIRQENPTTSDVSILVKLVCHAQVSVNGQPMEHSDLVQSLAGFFRNPWFRRVWVLQEVSCASSTVYVFARRNAPTLLWTEILTADLYLSVAFRHLKTGASALASPWQKITRNTSEEEANSFESLPILDLFEAVCQKFDATDPRDKLFGLLAIARDTQNMTNLSALVAPNYSKSNAQVFVDFTRWCIQRDRSLDVLGYVTYMLRPSSTDDRAGEGPSWALSPRQKFRNNGSKLCLVSSFRVAADARLDMSLLDSPPHDWLLKVRGYRLCTVAQAEKVYFTIRWDAANELYLNDETTHTYYSGGVHWLWQALRGDNGKDARFCDPITGQIACTCQKALDQFLLMLTCGGLKEHGDCDHSKGIHKIHWLEPADMYQMFATYWINHGEARADPNMELFCQHVREILQPLAGQGDPEAFSEILISNAGRKCLFTTTCGRAGLCPPGTQGDDAVVALFGGKAPFILRALPIIVPGDQEWEFIGECFVHDLMNGKFVDALLKRQEPSELFKLR